MNKSNELPKSIKVGWRTFTVVALDSVARDDYAGQADLTKGEIRLNMSLDRELLVQTLTHEVVHSIVQVFMDGRPINEASVAMLANGLQTVLRDNPQLLDWFKAQLQS